MRLFICSIAIALTACGSSATTGDDGGANDSGNGGDAPQDATSDVATPDGSSSNDAGDAGNIDDSGSEGGTFGDGGLGVGDMCNPNDNQCMPSLLCCSEPKHPPPGTIFECEMPTKGKCPLLP